MLVDVRNPDEFVQDHLDAADNIPLDKLKDDQREFESVDKVFLICQSGIRSNQARHILEKRFPKGNFINVRGGLNRIRTKPVL